MYLQMINSNSFHLEAVQQILSKVNQPLIKTLFGLLPPKPVDYSLTNGQFSLTKLLLRKLGFKR